MNNRSHRFTLISLISITFLALSIGAVDRNISQIALPPSVSVSAGPILTGPQGDVDVYTVHNGVANGQMIVKGAKIRNRSEKPVYAVKLGWRLYRPHSYNDTLAIGSTPFLGVELAPLEKAYVPFTVVSSQKIMDVTRGMATGHYRFEIFVADVLFQMPEEGGPFDNEQPAVILLPNLQGDDPCGEEELEKPCQDQECKWETNCYRCRDCAGSTCKVNNCENCCSGRCPAKEQ